MDMHPQEEIRTGWIDVLALSAHMIVNSRLSGRAWIAHHLLAKTMKGLQDPITGDPDMLREY